MRWNASNKQCQQPAHKLDDDGKRDGGCDDEEYGDGNFNINDNEDRDHDDDD
jgi:hypothetical protein